MWRQLAVVVDDSVAEDLADALCREGAASVSLEDAEDRPLFEPKPGEMPIWQRTKVVGLFAADVDLTRVIADLRAGFGTAIGACEDTSLEDRIWEREWLKYFKPVRYGQRLWVCPSGFSVDEEDSVVMSLDPGLAFGTGSHPTTALCLEWLDSEPLENHQVLDYGCGSGILAVAALLLGAEHAVAVDIDPQALQATTENASKNGVAPRVHCCLPRDLGANYAADVVIANILSNPLIELVDELTMRVKPGGQLVLSGILSDQTSAVAEAYGSRFQFEDPVEKEGWVRLSGKRK